MRTLLLISLMFGMSGAALAAEPWTNCDNSKKAWLTTTRVVRDCPKTVKRPGEPAKIEDPEAALDCPTKTVTLVVNHPELDYICAYPTAAESGDDETRNTNRCINADKKQCRLDAGGIDGPGAHSIPSLGWYHQVGSTLAFPNIRCQCGCFVGETLISSGTGQERIDSLANLAKTTAVGIMQFSKSNGQNLSQMLRGLDFTVGPEEKPMIRITTRSGVVLDVTDLHPILSSRNGLPSMIQAKDLRSGEALFDENENFDEVLSLESYKLEPNANNVYNLDTRSPDPEDHVISANRILVGDLYWQKRLSEDTNRADNLLVAAQNP